MKLRNKKTNEIIELFGISRVNGKTFIQFEDEKGNYKFESSSLAELTKEWEDYEDDDLLDIIELLDKCLDNEILPDSLNDFVKKLKAWKRLKDKGLTFCGWKITDDGCSVDVETTLDAEIVRAEQKYITDDLNLLFGGEHD